MVITWRVPSSSQPTPGGLCRATFCSAQFIFPEEPGLKTRDGREDEEQQVAGHSEPWLCLSGRVSLPPGMTRNEHASLTTTAITARY